MKLACFIALCKQHNETAGDHCDSSVDMFVDRAVGETAVVVITPTDSVEPTAYWVGIQDLEAELKTFVAGEYFSDDVREMMARLGRESALERLT